MTIDERTDNSIIEKIRTKSADGKSWNIDHILLSFLSENIFYAEISRRIHKVATHDIPTCGVSWDPRIDSITLFYNPDFLSKYTPRQIRGVLKHEYNHLVFGHLNARRRTPHRMWNIATDLAINSLIYAEDKRSYSDDKDLPLPKCGLVPGRPVYLDNEGRTLTREEEKALPLAALIRHLPPLLSSEQYFNTLMEESKKHKKEKCPNCGGTGNVPRPGGADESDEQDNNDENQEDQRGSEKGGDSNEMTCPCCGGEGEIGGNDWIDSLDDHNMWDEIGDDNRDYIENRVRDIVEKAVQRADQESDGWGSIPIEISSAIRKSISRIVPWRSVLRQFIGTLLPGGHTTSLKRINRRYPYIHPGVKRSRAPGLLIAVDQSASVNNDMLSLFFGELTNLAKHCDIEILPFDSTAKQDDIYTWRKGQPPPKGRIRNGGTDFNAVTMIVNDPKNRGRWDGVLIATDGECCKPNNVRIQRGWVLPPGHTLPWTSNELQVFIDKNQQMKGSWR